MTSAIAGSNAVTVVGILSLAPSNSNFNGNLNALEAVFGAPIASAVPDLATGNNRSGNISITVSTSNADEVIKTDAETPKAIISLTNQENNQNMLADGFAGNTITLATAENSAPDIKLEISLSANPAEKTSASDEVVASVTVITPDAINPSGNGETTITLITTQVDNAPPVAELEITCEAETGEVTTVRIAVDNLQTSCEPDCGPLTTRQQLYHSLQTVFDFLGLSSTVEGIDFAAVFFLSLQGLEVDTTGSINPLNTKQGGVLTAWASTYIGSAIPPDIEADLIEAGASEDFITGYNAVRQYLMEQAASNAALGPDDDVVMSDVDDALIGSIGSEQYEDVQPENTISEPPMVIAEITLEEDDIVDLKQFLLDNGSYAYLQDFNLIDYIALRSGNLALGDLRAFKEAVAKKRQENELFSQDTWQALFARPDPTQPTPEQLAR